MLGQPVPPQAHRCSLSLWFLYDTTAVFCLPYNTFNLTLDFKIIYLFNYLFISCVSLLHPSVLRELTMKTILKL